MTRLDRFIGRMVSQRACIDHAVILTEGLTGPVFELGLGNGRTFDHIRARFAERHIFVFDQVVTCHPSTIPTDEQLVLGDVFETLPRMLKQHGPVVSFAHADLGGPDPKQNDAFARALSPLVEAVMAPGGVMVASDEMYFDTLVQLALPEGAMPERAFIYQKPA